MTRCATCGVQEPMPFVCRYCGELHCNDHRLPEAHECSGLASARQVWRERGREAGAAPREKAVYLSLRARLATGYDRVLAPFGGQATMFFVVAALVVFLLQLVTSSVGDGCDAGSLCGDLFVLSPGFWARPWTILTSVFAHGGVLHLFINMFVLWSFGPSLERLLGRSRFSLLFVGAGAIAGVAQSLVFQDSVVGASGGILALLGTLTVLAPNWSVLLFFVIPAPLWLITSIFALYDLSTALAEFEGVGTKTAGLAHLAGLAIGVAYGWQLKKQGMRVHVATAARRS
ncbi:MAG: rhomboid family intramembrane serine protease [Methanobacteriota archaeon]